MSQQNRESELPDISIARGGGDKTVLSPAKRRLDTFFRDSKFFFTLYHAGALNIILHLVSFFILFYGLTVKSLPLVLIGLFIFDEMGHAYNYFFVRDRDPRFGLRMIPYQLVYGGLIMLVLLKLFGWV